MGISFGRDCIHPMWWMHSIFSVKSVFVGSTYVAVGHADVVKICCGREWTGSHKFGHQVDVWNCASYFKK